MQQNKRIEMIKRVGIQRFLILLFILVFASGCREKAEAIKVAAGKFRIESTAALDKINNLFAQSISMPAENTEWEIKRIIKDLEESRVIDSNSLSFIIGERETGREGFKQVDHEFEKIRQGYYQFEAMFRSLPEGTFFAGDAVKRAERHVVNLTVQMINFADFLNRYHVQFTGRRTVILEEIAIAKEIKDDSWRKERLKLAARDILRLRDEEYGAKRDAILQCLKAAEAGKLVSDLIRSYNSMSANDILVLIRNTMGFISEISGDKDLAGLLGRYKSIETLIRQDPYYKPLLEEKIL